MRTSTLTSRTQLPHVELDVNCDTTAVLKIPFISSLPYYDLRIASGIFDNSEIGQVQIFPYSPLTTPPAGAISVGYTLWVHFEDVTLNGITMPQSGSYPSASELSSEAEQRSSQIGPVTTTLRASTVVFDAMTRVPLLSSFGSTASWVTKLASHVTSFFGWSKPSTVSPPIRVLRNLFPYLTVTDGGDGSMPLSSSATNAVGVSSGFDSTDIDQMSFNYILTKPAYFQTITWLPNQASGTQLTDIYLNPSTFSTTYTDSGVGAGNSFESAIPVTYFARMFEYYRGGFTVRLKFVKTEFHSGRLSASFIPFTSFNQQFLPGSDFLKQVYTSREIMDVRAASEFTFHFPYTSIFPYLSCRGNANTYGVLRINVIDPLVSPATVAQSVQILFEVSAMEDFEFFSPTGRVYTSYIPAVAQSGSYPSISECEAVTRSIGGLPIPPDDLSFASSCVGERVISLRSLTRKFVKTNEATGVGSTTALPATSDLVYVRPFSSSIYAGGSIGPGYFPDYLDVISQCYALNRGGVRLKLIDTSPGAPNEAISAQLLYIPPTAVTGFTAGPLVISNIIDKVTWNATGSAILPTANPTNTASPTVFASSTSTGGIEVSVPQYHYTHSRSTISNITWTIAAGTFNLTSYLTSRLLVVFSKPTNFSSYTNVDIYRAGSDDYNCGYFVGVPPFVTNY